MPKNIWPCPLLKDLKTANERFAGAIETYAIEALMQDGKALQAGTSHFLGQNFAKAFDVKFVTENNQEEYVWATSWGVSTRLMGGLIMTHSDDDGLVLPPNLAPIQVVIVPIPKPDPELNVIAEQIKNELKSQGVSVKIDLDDKKRPGFKFAEYEMMGIPIRIGIGKRDLASGVVEIARRDTKEKISVNLDSCGEHVVKLLAEIQQNLKQRAIDYRSSHTTKVDSWDEFVAVLDQTWWLYFGTLGWNYRN